MAGNGDDSPILVGGSVDDAKMDDFEEVHHADAEGSGLRDLDDAKALTESQSRPLIDIEEAKKKIEKARSLKNVKSPRNAARRLPS